MPQTPDLLNQRFGRLTVVDRLGAKNGKIWWRCLCDCGGATSAPTSYLRSGNTHSCGCRQKEAAAETCVSRTTHGQSHQRLYNIWRSMRARCENPKSISFPNYGARGIRVCDAWRAHFEAFAAWARANGYADHLQIDRINGDGNYEPDNCRWADVRSQAENRRSTRLITFNGRSRTACAWARITGIPSSTIKYRLRSGWPVDAALSVAPATANRVTRAA